MNRPRSRESVGAALCLLSATSFGAMAVLATLAYDAGASVPTVLAVRFALAAGVLWLIVARPWNRAGARPLPPRRTIAAGLALGAFLYAAESGLFFASLTRLDVSMAELVLFTYPAIVLLASLLTGREAPSLARTASLLLASGGIVLVLVAGGPTRIDTFGLLLAAGAAVGYSVYVLVADSLSGKADAPTLAALTCTGAAFSFTVGGAAAGDLSLSFGAMGWPLLIAIALFSTVVPLVAFLGGVRRIGPSNASILSTFEPVVTLSLAFVLLGDRLAPSQLVGGLFVLGAVMVLQLGSGRGAESVPAQSAPGEAAMLRTGEHATVS